MSSVARREQIRVGIAAKGSSTPNAGVNGLDHGNPSIPGGPDRAKLDAFCAALGSVLGAGVTALRCGNYRELLDATVGGDVDIAWLPPVVALRATARGRMVPIALPLRHGTAYYSTALFTRPESSLMGIEDLSGVHAAWVDRQSAAGYLVIRGWLRMRGVNLDRAFGREAFYGDHAGVVRAVSEGMADVGASFVHIDPRRTTPLRAGWGATQVRVLATAGPIPADMIAAAVRLTAATLRSVQRALLMPPNDALRRATNELFAAHGFLEPSPRHLEPLTALLSHLEDRPELASIVPPPRSERPPTR